LKSIIESDITLKLPQMKALSPICLFVYNRLPETQQTIEALQQNYLAGESELFIFSDGARNESVKSNVQAVREYIKTISGFKSVEIIESENNRGLANSIISGVTNILEKFEKVIVLEDDLITAPNFMNFMNQGLDYYQTELNIQSISAYSLSLKDKSKTAYFQIRPGSWGWATWRDRWNTELFNKENIKTDIELNPSILKELKDKCGADMSRMVLGSINNKNDSWYARWAFDHYRKNHYTVFPAYSYIQNIGFNADGTHCKGINTYPSELIDPNLTLTLFPEFHIPDPKITKEFISYFSRKHKIIIRLKLLINQSGRSLLLEEFKNRMGLKR